MGPNGKDTGQGDLDLARGPERGRPPLELVFDFTGLERQGLCDLALILTARLQADPEERVWVRALPDATWTVLCGLGLDHLFHVLPRAGTFRN